MEAPEFREVTLRAYEPERGRHVGADRGLAGDPDHAVGDAVTELPEFVFLITVDGQWPVSVVADGPHAETAVLKEVERRRRNAEGFSSRVHIWRAQLTEVVEMSLEPARIIPATLQVKPTGQNIR